MINAVWAGAAGISTTRMDPIPKDPPRWDIRTITPSAQLGDALTSLVAGCGHLCCGAPARKADLVDDRSHRLAKLLQVPGEIWALKEKLKAAAKSKPTIYPEANLSGAVHRVFVREE